MDHSAAENQSERSIAPVPIDTATDIGLVFIRIVGPATATPPVVRGTSTLLSVLGDDVLGESLLRYTWEVRSAPRDAKVSFTENGSNAAKSTTAMFTQPGDYSFVCRVTNGLFGVVSAVDVLVETTVSQLAA